MPRTDIQLALHESFVDMPEDTADLCEKLADVLREIGAEFKTRAKAIERQSYGGDGNMLTFGSIGEALDKLAQDVAENGQVTLV